MLLHHREGNTIRVPFFVTGNTKHQRFTHSEQSRSAEGRSQVRLGTGEGQGRRKRLPAQFLTELLGDTLARFTCLLCRYTMRRGS